jgi:PAS domain S-box-containing protein
MDSLVSRADRVMVRQLLSRSFCSVEEAATEICALLRAATGADLVYASRVDGDELVVLAADDGLDSGMRAGLRMALEATFCVRALRGEGPQATSDLRSGPYADLACIDELGATSYAMTPVWDADGQAGGTLCLLYRDAREVSDDELALLELLGGILAREQQLDGIRGRARAHAAELEKANHRYVSLVDDLGDIIVELGPDGAVSYVNRACTALTGLPAEEVVGKDMMEHVHPDDRTMAAEHLAEILGGSDQVREARFVAVDGSVRWMTVRGRPLFDDAGGFGGFLGVLHDVTDRVEGEQRVRDALAEAEAARDDAQRASRAKSEFLSRMSHELRTPLNAILGFGQLLELGELDGEDAENVDHILRAGRHLLDLINEVLDVVRIEAGKLSLSLEPVEVAEVVTESLDLVRPAAADRGIGLRAPKRSGAGVAVADRQRLKQVLVNLLSNAVKYNVDGGEVVVSCELVPATTPGPDGGPARDWLRLSVRDTGRGIPADRLDDVFTPFDRLGAEASGIEGTGVGLSLTRTLVEAQGGRIGVVSELGRGSTFWVDLPAAETTVDEPEPDAEEAEFSRTVLYVEDNTANVTLMRRVLARRPQVRLVVVEDGSEAVAVAQRLLPDLVLLDLHLPGLHGAGVLAALRGSDDARLSKVPVVVVTADLSVGNERRMLEAGATLFLPKPIDVRSLLAVIDEQLDLA